MKDFLDILIDKIPIVDIVQEKVSLTRKGREYIGLCPFHKEKTPSFFVNPIKGNYYCFGCQAKGNIFSFYMEIYRMNFPEAVEELAKKAGLTVPNKTTFTQNYQEDIQKKRLLEVCDLAKNYFKSNLLKESNKKANSYLNNRGLSPESIEKFELGFSVANAKDFWKLLEENGYKEEDILEIGLKNYNQKGEIYDFFRNRIIFPIKNSLGKTIAFGGRGLGDEIPKYLNTKESKIFFKKSTLYGLNVALEFLRDNHLIVVEGYMDVISLFNAGCKTAIAGLGTSITIDHLKAINKYDKSPIFCLDGDNAGIKATQRVIEMYLDVFEAGMNPKFVVLEDSHDPDSFIIKYGIQTFNEKIKEASNISEMLWYQESKNMNLELPEDSILVLHSLEKKIAKIKDPKLRNQYLYFFKNKLYDAGRFKKKELNNSQIKDITYYNSTIDYQNERDGILIACILMFPEIIYEVEEKLGLYNFKDEKIEKIRQILLQRISEIDNNWENILLEIQSECDYVLNMNMVKPKLQRIDSLDIAKQVFYESYKLVEIYNLEQQKQDILKEIKMLGDKLCNLNSELVFDQQDINEDSQLEKIKIKIKILMNQKLEINKHIDCLKKIKLD